MLSLTNICSNFVDCKTFPGSETPDILVEMLGRFGIFNWLDFSLRRCLTLTRQAWRSGLFVSLFPWKYLVILNYVFPYPCLHSLPFFFITYHPFLATKSCSVFPFAAAVQGLCKFVCVCVFFVVFCFVFVLFFRKRSFSFSDMSISYISISKVWPFIQLCASFLYYLYL